MCPSENIEPSGIEPVQISKVQGKSNVPGTLQSSTQSLAQRRNSSACLDETHLSVASLSGLFNFLNHGQLSGYFSHDEKSAGSKAM